MSSVLIAPEVRINSRLVQVDSLLEHLYTYFGVDQLNDMLNSRPSEDTLAVWSVTEEEYKSNVQAAIDLVVSD